MTIYDEMRAVAVDVFGEFQQGVVEYVALIQSPGSTPDDPQPAEQTRTRLTATVRPVSTKYVDGSHIVQSDKQVSMPNDGTVVPSMSGSVDIDGVPSKIIEIMPRPSAGVPVVWLLIVRR